MLGEIFNIHFELFEYVKIIFVLKLPFAFRFVFKINIILLLQSFPY